ncbi:DUF7500 family protein [Halobaculum sp. EA56]|uniref:DUF7500 family protein n=1 Tax=Halobaculum sp. EA56 TaxID=3421648 RepID=UPI003EBA79DF
MSDADGPDSDAADGEEGPVRDVVRVDGDEPDGAEGGDDDGGPPPGRDGVMDPDDLDIRERDGVDETDDGRYVISTGVARDDVEASAGAPGERPIDGPPGGPAAGSPPDAPVGAEGAEEGDGSDADRDRDAGASDSGVDARAGPGGGERPGAAADPDRDDDPLEAVAAELDALSASHGFALAVAAGGETDTLRVASGEPTDTLETALRWYARRVNPGTPAEETVAALLAASDLDLG